MLNKYDFAVGLLVFNPFDDEYHLERIEKCLSSILNSIRNYDSSKIVLNILFNDSLIEHIGLPGVGSSTKNLVYNLSANSNINLEVCSHVYNNSMSVGYNYLFKRLHSKYDPEYITIFADDYILPVSWFNIIQREILRNKIDYLIPSTSFVAQHNLLVPFKISNSWNLNYIEGTNKCIGVTSGVSIRDVELISRNSQMFSTIKHVGPPSFETTVFSKKILDKIGYLCEDYFFLFFNSEYFIKVKNAGFKGAISRKSFVFHYGKGGTKSVFKLTGDEKFSGSPFESKLISDINLYNFRNNKRIKKWWADRPKAVATPSNIYVYIILYYNNALALLKGTFIEKIIRRFLW